MKKKLFAALFMVLFLVSTSLFAFFDWSDTGWTSSNGLNSVAGQASNLQPIPGGWSFYCSGDGICYQIIGGGLWIYSTVQSPEEGDPFVEITKQ